MIYEVHIHSNPPINWRLRINCTTTNPGGANKGCSKKGDRMKICASSLGVTSCVRRNGTLLMTFEYRNRTSQVFDIRLVTQVVVDRLCLAIENDGFGVIALPFGDSCLQG